MKKTALKIKKQYTAEMPFFPFSWPAFPPCIPRGDCWWPLEQGYLAAPWGWFLAPSCFGRSILVAALLFLTSCSIPAWTNANAPSDLGIWRSGQMQCPLGTKDLPRGFGSRQEIRRVTSQPNKKMQVGH